MTQPAWAGMIETTILIITKVIAHDPARMGWDD